MKKAFGLFAGLLLIVLGISYATTLPNYPETKADQMTHEKTTPEYLYKVISVEGWQESQQQDHVVNSAIDDKFIHLATEKQLPHVTHKFWHGKKFFILKLDPKKMKGRLVFEVNPGGTIHYYHLYEGIIPLDAVIDVISDDKTDFIRS